MEERNLLVHLNTHTCSPQNLFQCDIFDYYCFQVVIKTHEKQIQRRETSQFFLKHTLAVHFVKKLFQCDICYYCCFQVDIKIHEKQTWRRETLQFILIHILAVHCVLKLFQCHICHYCFFKLLLKRMKNKHGGKKPNCVVGVLNVS